MTKIFNEQGINQGLVFSAYRQGGNWIVNITNDHTDCWHERTLHYSIVSKQEVMEWIHAYVLENYEGERYEVRI